MLPTPKGWSLDQAIDFYALQEAALAVVVRVWPYPHWLKFWADGEDWPRMLYINAAYEQWYDVKKDDYLNKTDGEVWPESVATAFRDMDREAINQPEVLIERIEPVPIATQQKCRSRKIATRIERGPFKGWAIYGESDPIE